MSEPRVLLEWQYTPDYDDATPETYRLREARCSGRPLVEWRNSVGDWMSDSTINWTDEAILAEFVRHVRDLAASRERIAALEKALSSYGEHQGDCLLRYNVCGDERDFVCTCGLTAALGEEGTDGE